MYIVTWIKILQQYLLAWSAIQAQSIATLTSKTSRKYNYWQCSITFSYAELNWFNESLCTKETLTFHNVLKPTNSRNTDIYSHNYSLYPLYSRSLLLFFRYNDFGISQRYRSQRYIQLNPFTLNNKYATTYKLRFPNKKSRFLHKSLNPSLIFFSMPALKMVHLRSVFV